MKVSCKLCGATIISPELLDAHISSMPKEYQGAFREGLKKCIDSLGGVDGHVILGMLGGAYFCHVAEVHSIVFKQLLDSLIIEKG